MPKDPKHQQQRLMVRDVETSTGAKVKVFYGPDDLVDFDYGKKSGNPGEYPFTRGIFPTMYREQLWTMRAYAGFSTSEATNERFKFLLASGQTGLSLAFDLPTQLGYDSDHPMARYDVGRVGVAIDSLADMEDIFAGIPLDQISTSFTINATAAIILAMYQAAGEKQGVPPGILRGTVQNDVLKDYIARGTWIFPPLPSIRLTGDIIEYCMKNIPRFNPISISATHIAEAGANSAQTIGYPFLNGMVYIEEVLRRGYLIDEFAPSLTFHLPAGGLENYGFFEITAKFRAARRLWAKLMKEKYGATNPRAMSLKFSTGAGGSGLTAQQPKNNIARLAYYALAAVLGGTRSLNLAAYDEAYAIPTEESARSSLRIQQILAYETGVADVVDPLGGSYYVEKLTDEIEAAILETMEDIRQQGGMLLAISQGYVQKQLSRQAYEYEKKIASGEIVIVGRNKFRTDEAQDEMPIYEMNPATLERQLNRLNKIRSGRNVAQVKIALADLKSAVKNEENLMPFLVNAVKAYATVGEIVEILREEYGTYQEPVVI